jgi:NADPH:quinone reductase-like Zn-dependent oxidoreductase
MKAVFINCNGGAECVQIGQVPAPVHAENEVLLDVRAAALNHLDIWVRKGGRGPAPKFPHVIGSDAAGVVAAVGSRVHGVRAGDEVIINPALSCGCCEYCRRGEQSECAAFGIVGMARWGTFAEKVAVPAENVYPKPAHLNFEEAAALPLSCVTAFRMLMTRAGLRPGDTVLIHGIGGGVAIAALLFAKRACAEVIVTSSSDEKLRRARELGADHAINYTAVKDVAHAVREYTGGRGVDIVVDAVGAAAWPIDFAAVRRGGHIVICGVTTGAEAKTDLQRLYWHQLNIHGSTMGSNEDFREMLRTVSNAQIKPVVDSVLPLDRAREAMARMEAGGQFGKIVLKVSS